MTTSYTRQANHANRMCTGGLTLDTLCKYAIYIKQE